jgi:hypothetical protein
VLRADSLATFVCRLSRSYGILNVLVHWQSFTTCHSQRANLILVPLTFMQPYPKMLRHVKYYLLFFFFIETSSCITSLTSLATQQIYPDYTSPRFSFGNIRNSFLKSFILVGVHMINVSTADALYIPLVSTSPVTYDKCLELGRRGCFQKASHTSSGQSEKPHWSGYLLNATVKRSRYSNLFYLISVGSKYFSNHSVLWHL